MKTKVVLMQEDRTNAVVKLRKKHWTSDSSFKIGDKTRFIDADRFQITTEQPWWKLGFKRYFVTYYYAHDHVKPLPVPTFEYSADGDHSECVSSEEIAVLFDPFFYRTLAHTKATMLEMLQFYANIGSVLGIIYLVYLMRQIHETIVVP